MQLIRKQIARYTILLEGPKHSVAYDTNNSDAPVRVSKGRRMPNPILLRSGEVNNLSEFAIYEKAVLCFEDGKNWPTKREMYVQLGLTDLFEEFDE